MQSGALQGQQRQGTLHECGSGEPGDASQSYPDETRSPITLLTLTAYHTDQQQPRDHQG